MMSLMSPIYSASVSVVRPARASTSCISLPRANRLWIGSLGTSQPALAAVLSDINMPGMDGLELLGEIKQRRPDLPVMMVTAYGDDDRRRRARVTSVKRV
jgi:CheY-like chemotaxis protein